MADRLRIAVIGLPELGDLLEEARPAGAEVVTIDRGEDIGAELATRARGATRDTLLCVVADTGDPGIDRLPDTLARAGFRAVVLAGLPGARGTHADHENLQVLSAPFSGNDVLAALSSLPGEVPFFVPIEGGDRVFGDDQLVLPPFRTNGRRERNGVVYPSRLAADDADADDLLGPPVGAVSAPTPPPAPSPLLGPGDAWPQPQAADRWPPPATPPLDTPAPQAAVAAQQGARRHAESALVAALIEAPSANPGPASPRSAAHPTNGGAPLRDGVDEDAAAQPEADPPAGAGLLAALGAAFAGNGGAPPDSADQSGDDGQLASLGAAIADDGEAPADSAAPRGVAGDDGPLPSDGPAFADDGGALDDSAALAGEGGPLPSDGPAFADDGGVLASSVALPGEGGLLTSLGAAFADDGGALADGAARPPELADVPSWAQLPAQQPLELAGWVGPSAGSGPAWATPRALTTYNDEPVMPGARLPAVEPHQPRQRGDVISVCSYKGGSGKCVAGASLVLDPATGVPHRLDAVIRDPGLGSVLTLDWTTVRAVPIAAKIDSGVQPTVRVSFASGRDVTVTPHHPFLLGDGWRPAEDIAVGERAALPGRLPFPAVPLRLSATELAALVTRLSDHGCQRRRDDRPAPPDAAYRLPPEQLARFLSLLWTADGTVDRDGTPRLAAADEAVVRMVQHLLLRFGVQSRLATDPGQGTWRLAVLPGFRAAFADTVALCGPPGDRLAAAASADLKPPLDGDIYWDEVTAIVPAGTQQVWDLTVDETHCFVANDIVVHNTTTALLAASTLARAVRPGGKRVALVDANTAQSSVATILQRPVRGSVLDLVRTDVDEALLAQALTPVPEAGELDVLFGAPDLRSTDERLLTPALWRRIVATLRRSHDYVIVDTPVAEAVGHELFDDFVLRDSTVLLVVLDPNRETIHNNVEWLDIIGDPVSAGGRNFPPERVAIVLNRADPDLVWNEHSVGDHFRRYHFLGAIPHSAAVQQAADDARLVQRFDPAVDLAVRTMLAALVDEPLLLEPDGGRRPGGSAFDRLLARLFGRRSSKAECSSE
jgi:MinD-like ATPase involved in chromosome partitioning or flagellar assembly